MATTHTQGTMALAHLRPGDELLALGGTCYNPPRVVKSVLRPIDPAPGSPAGVEFEPRPGESIRWVLYPAEVGTLPLTVRRRR